MSKIVREQMKRDLKNLEDLVGTKVYYQHSELGDPTNPFVFSGGMTVAVTELSSDANGYFYSYGVALRAPADQFDRLKGRLTALRKNLNRQERFVLVLDKKLTSYEICEAAANQFVLDVLGGTVKPPAWLKRMIEGYRAHLETYDLPQVEENEESQAA